MTKGVQIIAEKKEANGKGNARELRRAGKLPAIIYGGSHKEVMISMELKEFVKEYQKGNIQARLFEIKLDGKSITAIPREVQIDPVSDMPIHADFLEVTKDSRIKIALHVKIINEDKSPGLKKGGVLNVVYRVIDAYCDPTNIPEHLIVDISGLEIGRNLHINDVSLPKNVVPVDKSNFTVVSISGRAEEKEEVAVAATPEAAAPGAAPAAQADSKDKK